MMEPLRQVVIPFEATEASASLSPMDMPRALVVKLTVKALEVAFKYFVGAEEAELEAQAGVPEMRIWVGKDSRRVLRLEISRDASLNANSVAHDLQKAADTLTHPQHEGRKLKPRERAHYQMIPMTGAAISDALARLRASQGSLRP